jgi:hypothetical protein
LAFIQTYSFSVPDHGALADLLDEWARGEGPSMPGFRELWLMRERESDQYLLCAEFATFEEAMASSVRPETGSLFRDLRDVSAGDLEPRGYELGTVVEPQG